LRRNFAFPYFSRDIAEFWRRWHISLSTWFRDYVYIPLGGSRGGVWMKVRNIFIIFIVSGFWHGANWTFIVWGALNAVYFLPLMLTGKNRINTDSIAKGKFLPNIKESLQVASTFFLIVLAWIIFRAETLSDAIGYLSVIFSLSLFSIPSILPIDFIVIVIVFMIIEWFSREKQHPFDFSINTNKIWTPILRICSVCILIWSIILWGAFENKEFIYFQF
jgi:D-alanyl-lipoteichoic acid acyltransferase DltB (MBOAT superfamily)